MTEDEKEYVRGVAARLYEDYEDDKGFITIPYSGEVEKSIFGDGYWVEAVVWVGEDVVHGEQQTLPDA